MRTLKKRSTDQLLNLLNSEAIKVARKIVAQPGDEIAGSVVVTPGRRATRVMNELSDRGFEEPGKLFTAQVGRAVREDGYSIFIVLAT